MNNEDKDLRSIVIEAMRKKKGEPEPNGDITITNGKKVKVDVDKLKGKDADKNFGIFAIDEPKDEDAVRWDGEPKPKNVKMVMAKIAADEPFFIMGHAGWGKTAIIKKVAKKFGKTIITVYLDKIPPEDLAGIPVPVKGENGRYEQQVLLPTWAQYMWDHKDDTDFLLFFDEMNQATPEVLNALMPIILETTICNIKFHNFVVGAAGNYQSENDVNKLPGPVLSRVAPVIIWQDNDPESWEDAMNYIKKEWSGKLEGHADNIIDVIDKYKMLFKNPREIETKIFDWIKHLQEKAKKTGKALDPDVFDADTIGDRLATLFVHEDDVDNMAVLKREVWNNYDAKAAIEDITVAIQDALFADNSSTKKQTKNNSAVGTMNNEDLNNAIAVANLGYIYYPTDNDGKKTSKSDTIIVSRDNIADIYGLTKQEVKQIEIAMGDPAGDNGFYWQTEKEAKKQKKTWLTYAEACKKYPDLE